MRTGVSFVLLAMIAMLPQGAIAQTETPSWALDTSPADFPAEVVSIVFPNGYVWDGDHPSMTFGRWQVSRSGPLVEHLSTCTMRRGVLCFGGYIEPFECYNPAGGTAFVPCTVRLYWEQNERDLWEATCQIDRSGPEGELVSFRITCPAEVRFVK